MENTSTIDYSTIEYFYFEKGDVTRYTGWNLEQLKKECPELAYAYEQMENSRKVFEIVLKEKAHS